jgi:histidinol-phosphatase
MRDEIDAIVRTVNRAIERTDVLLMEQWKSAVRNPIRFESKFDRSPVTETDKQIEREIRAMIAQDHPGHSVIGEELGTTDDNGSRYRWILDPIDGTKQFVRGMRFFGTQIAVLREGEIIVAASNAPALDERVLAVKRGGARLNGQPLCVSDVKTLDQSFLAHGSIRHFDRTSSLPALLRLCQEAWGNRGFGDFWSYHLVAQGKIEAMLEAQTSIWDIAAVSLIVTEAGGTVTDFAGNLIDEKSTSIVASNGLVHDAILSVLREK